MSLKILVITQKVDKNDPILGFFHVWLQKLSQKAELFVIANEVGEYNLPGVKVFSLDKEAGRGRIQKFFQYQGLLLKILPEVGGAFFHMCPEYVLAAWPALFFFRRKSILWYVHKSVSWRLWLAEKIVDKIFTASPESFRLPSKKVVITGHGIDTVHFKPFAISSKDPQTLKLLAVGRITPSKDLVFLLEVMAILKEKNPERKIILDIVGAPITEGDYIYQEKLVNLLEAEKLEACVAFLGPKSYDEMPAVYAAHDILLHASETGSVDKVVLEAMAMSLLVLSTSEAFQKILPAGYGLERKDSKLMAERILALVWPKPDLGLREAVLKNNSLDALLQRISDEFAS